MVRVPVRKSDGTGIFICRSSAPARFTRTRRHRQQRPRASRPATTPASRTWCGGRAPAPAVPCWRGEGVSLFVVPANAGTHTPRRPWYGWCQCPCRAAAAQQCASVVMGPRVRGDDAASGPRSPALNGYSFTFQTARAHGFAISPPVPREVCRQRPPSEIRGRREDRVRAAPAVSCAKCANKNAHEHTGSAEAVRPSLRNGFTAYNALSPVTGLSCHRRPQEACFSRT
jgi:hypothetical protein